MCDICYSYKVITVAVGKKEICFKCIDEKRNV